MKFEPKKSITLNNIRELVSDESIWHWLFPEFHVVGKKFKARKEKEPSATIKSCNGTLFFKDFGNTDKPMSWWNYLEETANLSFTQALELVRDTFNLPLGYNSGSHKTTIKTPKIYLKKQYKEYKTIIRYRSREWGLWSVDKKFWNTKYQFTIKDLKYFNIVAGKCYWIDNGINYKFDATKEDPVYIYPTGNKRKIYRPFNNKGFKWISNVTKDDIYGLHLLKDFNNIEYLFIESSYKDTCVMYKAGFPSLPAPSETTFIPEDLFYKMIKKGIKPILHFDNDEAGIKNAKIFNERYNIPYLVIPDKKYKDPSDFVEAKGYNELKKLIFNQLKTI